MSTAPTSFVEERETIGPWDYTARIPDGASSRNYAFAPLLVSIIAGGIAMFLGVNVARNVPFWDNATVWVSLALSAVGLLLSAWMYFGKWVWTAPQMALFSLAGFVPIFWAFQGAMLVSFLLYSDASVFSRISILLVYISWHGWWISQAAKRCMSIWSNKTSREKVWITYECATVYRQFAAKAAMEAAGVRWHPGSFGILLPMLSCAPLYIYRHEIVGYLGVPWVPMIGFALGFSAFVLITTALAASVTTMLLIPARIVAATGKPVLVDMMTPANAPR